MRGPGRGVRPFGGGFIASEMILLLLMLVAFLAGVVLLVDRGVSTYDSAKGDRGLSEESDRVFDGIEEILDSARAVSLEQPGLDPAFNRTRLVLVAELDGMGPMSGVLDLRENEVAVVRNDPASPDELQVLVAGGSGGAGEAVLSSELDGDRTAPFSIEYRGLDGEKVGPASAAAPAFSIGSIRITLWLRSGSRSQRFTRLMELEEPLLLAPIDLENVF